MKYGILQKFINKNRSYQRLSPVGVVVHETATPNATDEDEFNYFNNHDNLKANAHAFVDFDSITQTVPWNEIAWGAGAIANHKFLQIELCHFDGDKFIEVWNRGVWLVAWLFINVIKIKNITFDNLMSHQEVSLKWKQTDHTDPYQYFKDNGKTMNDFRFAVQEEINNQLGGGSVNLNEALKILVDNKIISSPDYWLKACDVVKYLDTLIVNCANKVVK